MSIKHLLFLVFLLLSAGAWAADSDGDGVDDSVDAFPDDITESVDTDGDGVGDHADAYPNDPVKGMLRVRKFESAYISYDCNGYLREGTYCNRGTWGYGMEFHLTDLGMPIFLVQQGLHLFDRRPLGDLDLTYTFFPYSAAEQLQIPFGFSDQTDPSTNIPASSYTDGYLPELIKPGTALETNEPSFLIDVPGDATGFVKSYIFNNYSGQSYSPMVILSAEGDEDADGVPNKRDAFPGDPNETHDFDFDGIGDNADIDDDNDGVADVDDLAPYDPDFAIDDDGDLVDDFVDNCLETFNPAQSDNDGDGVGNACDPDIDGDGFDDVSDSHPRNSAYFTDYDRDLTNAHNDNCPFVSNKDQADADGDGFGDACDEDSDNDGIEDALDSHPLNSLYFTDFDRDLLNAHEDNCPLVRNGGQSDNDGDGLGNACDPDVDGDGYDDVVDNYPRNPSLH